MLFNYIIPIALGAAAVFQAGLNKQMGSRFSLPFAVFWNSLVVLLISVIFWRLRSSEPIRTSTISQLRMTDLIPGVLGFAFVLGLPVALSHTSATNVFVILVVSQILFGVIWDIAIEGRGLNWLQITGALVAVVGVLIVSLSRSP